MSTDRYKRGDGPCYGWASGHHEAGKPWNPITWRMGV